MVGIAQGLECWVVAPEAEGSIPSTHPSAKSWQTISRGNRPRPRRRNEGGGLVVGFWKSEAMKILKRLLRVRDEA